MGLRCVCTPVDSLVLFSHVRTHTHPSGHAKEIAQELDLEAWDGVCTLSGDGLLHEVRRKQCPLMAGL